MLCGKKFIEINIESVSMIFIILRFLSVIETKKYARIEHIKQVPYL